jgi:hypothetical protein
VRGFCRVGGGEGARPCPLLEAWCAERKPPHPIPPHPNPSSPSWSILFIVYIILVIVTAFVTIALTYFQLAAEVGLGAAFGALAPARREPPPPSPTAPAAPWPQRQFPTAMPPPPQDHRWWWRSFLCGGSTALFVYGYCFYYYYFRSNMSGFMQTSFFFLYMAMVGAWLFWAGGRAEEKRAVA